MAVSIFDDFFFSIPAILLLILTHILVDIGHCIARYSKLWCIGAGIALQKIKC